MKIMAKQNVMFFLFLSITHIMFSGNEDTSNDCYCVELLKQYKEIIQNDEYSSGDYGTISFQLLNISNTGRLVRAGVNNKRDMDYFLKHSGSGLRSSGVLFGQANLFYRLEARLGCLGMPEYKKERIQFSLEEDESSWNSKSYEIDNVDELCQYVENDLVPKIQEQGYSENITPDDLIKIYTNKLKKKKCQSLKFLKMKIRDLWRLLL